MKKTLVLILVFAVIFAAGQVFACGLPNCPHATATAIGIGGGADVRNNFNPINVNAPSNTFTPTSVNVNAPTNNFDPTNINVNAPSFKQGQHQGQSQFNLGINENFSNQTLIFERDYLAIPAPFSVQGLLVPYVDNKDSGWNTGGYKYLAGKWLKATADYNDTGKITDWVLTLRYKCTKKASEKIEVMLESLKPEPTGGKYPKAVGWLNAGKSTAPGQIVAFVAKKGMEIGADYAYIFDSGANKRADVSNIGFGIAVGGSGGGNSGASSGTVGAGASWSTSKGNFEDYIKVVFYDKEPPKDLIE